MADSRYAQTRLGPYSPRTIGQLPPAQQIAAYQVGRVCAHPTCTTALSIYNEDDECAVHQVGRPFNIAAHIRRERRTRRD